MDLVYIFFITTFFFFFFFNDPATTEIYTLPLPAALPTSITWMTGMPDARSDTTSMMIPRPPFGERSEEHTSELQSQSNLVCRLLLEKKKKQQIIMRICSNIASIILLSLNLTSASTDAPYA